MRPAAPLAAALLAFAVFAAACGGGEPAPATTGPPAPPASTAPPATTPPPTTPPVTSAPDEPPGGALARADVPHATHTDVTEAELSDLVAGNTMLALDLLRSISADGANTIVSPFSIAAALTMTYAGARGVTAGQMRDVLHLALADATVHEARNELTLRVTATPDPPEGDTRQPLQINVANSLWGQRGFRFESDFLTTLAAAYDAGVRLVDFIADAEGARTAINDWVAGETADRITDLLPPGSVTTDTRLVLTNAIWFKANWAVPFDPEATAPGTFRTLGGTEVSVPMMHGGGRMGYARGEGFAAARLAYAGDASMLLIVPDTGRFDEVLAGVDAEALAAVTASLSTHAVDLTMPKFAFESELSLRAVLGELGMPDAFDPVAADFSGISTARGDLYLQDVVHKAFISVDEQGTEAAAATASIIGVTSAPPPATLTLDRPFIFLIRHDSTGEILFAGTVVDPG